MLAMRLNAFEDFRLFLRENASSCGYDYHYNSNLNSNLIVPNEWHNNSWQVFFLFLEGGSAFPHVKEIGSLQATLTGSRD